MTAADLTVLETLTEAQFDELRRLVTAACADALAAERDLAAVNAELAARRRLAGRAVALLQGAEQVMGG